MYIASHCRPIAIVSEIFFHNNYFFSVVVYNNIIKANYKEYY